MIVVLVVASGGSWESPALTALAEHPGVVVLKRCVDVDDLLAAASSGQAQAAVVGVEAPGLDAGAVDHLRRHGVRPVAVGPDHGIEAARARATRIGIAELVPESQVTTLPTTLTAEPAAPTEPRPALPPPQPPPGADPVPTDGADAVTGRVLAVWGPAGAPGRSTLAGAVAAELARRRRRTILVDADPYGGSIAQQLGIMDEVAGILAAARLAAGGQLAERFATVQRAVDARLSVVTGLPRPDRWSEVRSGTVEQLLVAGRACGDVVVDTGFCLEDDPVPDIGTRPARNQLTLESLSGADEVLVVGSADPVGLSRLARGLVELGETVPDVRPRVVVNRMRSSLGWKEKDVAAMVAGVLPSAGLHFLPDDRAGVDRALVVGRTLLETGDSPLSRAVAGVVDALLPTDPTAARGRRRRLGLPTLRPRTAGTARPR